MAGMGQQNERNQRTLAAAPFDHTPPPPSLSRQLNPSPASSGERAHPNPQWAHQETLELINIRGELEKDFIASKRNKALWETVASRMREKGFIRTPDQCKCKWKNLLIRYKGKETSDPDDGRQCPFFEELRAILSERSKTLQQSFMEQQQVNVQSRKRTRSTNGDQYSDDFSQDEGHEKESLLQSSIGQKRKVEREEYVQAIAGDKSGAGSISASFDDISSSSSIQDMLKVFFQQQQRIEMQWRESMERHRRERELFEQEWGESMENLERERLMMEQEWREKEEQRKMREETRVEKMDALLTMLLNKLISEEHL